MFDYDPAGSLRHILTEATTGGGAGGAAGASATQPWHLERGNVLTDTGDTHYDNDSHKRRTRKTETLADGTAAITEYRWDIRDRLREVRLPDGRRASYRYDAFARRTEKVVHAATTLKDELATALAVAEAPSLPPETTRFLYDGDVLCAELHAPEQGGLRTHVHEPGTFVPLLQCEAASIFTVVNDHLGMPKELVDAQGRVAWAAAFSAWGRVTDVQRDAGIGTAEVSSPFRLLGQYADDETGLCYVRFRYSDARGAVVLAGSDRNTWWRQSSVLRRQSNDARRSARP